jgi:hypothetical protein
VTSQTEPGTELKLSQSGTAEAAKEPALDRSARGDRSRFLTCIILSYFALAFSLICISSFLQKSPTVDEPIHLFAGYSYLKWGDFRANPEHPPFAKIWAALPLLAFDIKYPVPSSPHWDLILEAVHPLPTRDIAQDMLFAENDGELLFFYAKLQMIALGILLGIFVYLWSKELFGLEAAIAALFIFALDPNMLAHSQIVHTDLPFTAFFFISTYFFWRVSTRLTWPNLVFTSVFFALAAITKYSAVTILPLWALLGLVKISSGEPQVSASITPRAAASRWDRATLIAGVLASAAMTAYFFIWAVYGFRYEAVTGGSPPLHLDWVAPGENTLFRRLTDFIAGARLFPEAWIYGQLYVVKYLQRPAFLLGQFSADGFWGYFPVAFAVKTPLPTLIFLVVSVWMLVRRRLDRKQGFFLLVPVIAYFFFAVWSRMNIGLRHILPIYPFLFVLAGGVARELWRGGRWARRGVVLLAVWSLWSCMATYPHYLAFFNELVGGPKNGYKVLLDSNLDWGQELKGLKRWMDANGVKKIKFLYFGGVDPEYYGIDASYVAGSWVGYDPPATQTPGAPKYVAISATLLQGITFDDKFTKPFRSRVPVATIGHSIFIFKLDESGIP